MDLLIEELKKVDFEKATIAVKRAASACSCQGRETNSKEIRKKLRKLSKAITLARAIIDK